MKIKTVCIIDDDSICVYGTKILLNHNNYFGSNILVYEDGYEALVNLSALAKTGKSLPDIILLDLNMPVMNGWEFLDEFVKLPLTTMPHIFVVSSCFGLKEIDKGKSYGIVNDFISKPLLESNLTNLFESIMTDTQTL
ncbi:two-component system response regulator [Maribacter sp. ACAM166]|uniref:response regulator n=1 Tax=Maribacter sp. ACAM166 TaxID=2508996 RepID=UPI0010FECFD3|nr:response regulator [Maribacter sp. ACAM166]TLP75452.1 response regulator [Maribacter sp. ACAM166]